MEQIIKFQFSSQNNLHDIRIVKINTEYYFILQDVCRALSLNNITTLRERLDQEGVRLTRTPTNGGIQNLYCINEKNLYKCIFKSRTQEAVKFQDWVFSEVLPEIRKTGNFDLNKHVGLESLTKHTDRATQIQNSKSINAIQFALGGVFENKSNILLDI